jgi:hypothetical protein
MAGALYIWIMLAVFVGVAALITLLIAILWIGHWFEKKTTGATHGFLEIPPGAESRPAASPPQPPAPPVENPPPR